MQGHAEQCVERHCGLGKEICISSHLKQVETPCVDDHLKNDDFEVVDELVPVCAKNVLKCLYPGRIGKTVDTLG